MSLVTNLMTRKKFLEHSLLGASGLLLSSLLLESCTDHRIPEPIQTPGTDPLPPIKVTITNNSSRDILLLQATGDDNAVPAPRYYGKNLQVVLDAENNSGGKSSIWKTGETRFITRSNLDPSVEFIVALPDNLFPIKMVRTTVLPTGQNEFNFTVTDDDMNHMSTANDFYQSLKAFPDSNLAQQFQDLLSSLTDVSVTKEMFDGEANFFFSSTRYYQTVTIDQVGVLSSYYNYYPYLYVSKPFERVNDKTYYLYSSDGNTVSYKGFVEIKYLYLASAPAIVDKKLLNFTISYTDEHNAIKTLYYNNGFFVDDLSVDNPGICLVGSFVPQHGFDGSDDYSPVPTLVGGINGTTVIGTNQKPQNKPSWFYVLTHPKDLGDLLNIALMVAGAMAGLEGLLVASVFLITNIDRDQRRDDGTLPDYIEKAYKDRLAIINGKDGKGIPVNTSLDNIPEWPY